MSTISPALAREKALARLSQAIRFAAGAHRIQSRHILEIRRCVDGVRCTDPCDGASRGVLDADEIIAAIGLRQRSGHERSKIHADTFADVRAALARAEGAE